MGVHVCVCILECGRRYTHLCVRAGGEVGSAEEDTGCPALTLQLPLLNQSLTDPETRFATRQPEWSSSPLPPPHSSRVRATCTGAHLAFYKNAGSELKFSCC